MREIFTINDASFLQEHPNFSEISKFPILTSSAQIAEALNKMYGKYNLKAYHFQKLILEFIEGWDDFEVKLEQSIKLNEICRELVNLEGNQRDKNLYLAFRKNASMLKSSLRLMIEAGFFYSDLKDKSKKEKIFKDIWKRFELEEISVSRFRSSMDIKAKDKERNKKILMKYFNLNHIPNKVFLIGFYFITPMQERVIKILEKTGVKIIFLNFYSKKYSKAFEIWKDSFSDEAIYPKLEDWRYYEKIIDSNIFGDILEGNSYAKLYKNKVKLIEFESELELALSGIWETDNVSIYTTNRNRTKDFMKEFYPEKIKDKKFIDYTLGQYIYLLNKMWNEEIKDLELDIETVIDCFSTGWVHCGDLKGECYVKDLEEIKIFFKNCKRKEEWNEIINTLIMEIRKFNCINKKSKNWPYINESLLSTLSIYNIEIKKLEEVDKLIRHLLRMAQMLFKDNENIYIKDYFNAIEKIIISGKKNKNIDMYEEEVIKDVMRTLGKYRDSKLAYFPSDLVIAVETILQGSVNSSNDGLELLEINTKEHQTVNHIMNIEVEQIYNDNREVHLIFCDEENMPGKESPYPWPLSEELISRMIESLDEKREARILANNLKFILSNAIKLKRYLFFCLLSNKEISISWVSKKYNEKIAVSPYCDLLNLESNKYDLLDFKSTDLRSSDTSIKVRSNKVYVKEKLPEEVELSINICPYRFFYDYVLRDSPYYTQEFHYNKYIPRLSTVNEKNEKSRTAKFAKDLLKNLNFYSELEKNNIYHYSKTINPNNDYLKVEDKTYALYLDKETIKENNYDRKSSKSIIFKKNNVDKKIYSNSCMYCPNQSYCLIKNRERDIF